MAEKKGNGSGFLRSSVDKQTAPVDKQVVTSYVLSLSLFHPGFAIAATLIAPSFFLTDSL